MKNIVIALAITAFPACANTDETSIVSSDDIIAPMPTCVVDECPPTGPASLVNPIVYNPLRGRPLGESLGGLPFHSDFFATPNGEVIWSTIGSSWGVPLDGIRVGDRITAIHAQVAGGGGAPMEMRVYSFAIGTGGPTLASLTTGTTTWGHRILAQDGMSHTIQDFESVVAVFNKAGSSTSTTQQVGIDRIEVQVDHPTL